MTRESLLKANQLMDQIERIDFIIRVIGVFGETKPEDPMKYSDCELVNHNTHGSITLNEGERNAFVMATINYRKSLEAELDQLS